MKAKKNFKVSVIIPVYNAEKFLRTAVESCNTLEEVGEIILVEDGSPDNALELCKELIKEYSKVKLLQHPGGENKGAGASRNLGIKNSKFDYIAFLDADDVYKNNRFESDKVLFSKKGVDGVFNNSETLLSHKKYFDKKALEVLKNTPCKSLLFPFFKGDFFISTNSITLKKSLIEKAGYFNENLKLHQDTHLWLKVFQLGKICPGNIENSVSLTREHDDRRIKNRNLKSKGAFLTAVLNDFKTYKYVDKQFMKILLRRYIYNKSKGNYPKMLFNSLILCFKYPKYFKIFLK